MPLIEYKKVKKAFGKKRIYDNLTLEIEKGETLTVIGGSGTGKSVLLKCLIGLMYPDAGEVVFDGVDVTTLDEKALREVRRRVSMVFQGAALFDSLSVGENIAYPLHVQSPDITPEAVRDRVAKVL